MVILINSILVLGILGFVFAALLGLAADYFKTEEDPRVATVLAILPGANCGVCGSASCHHFAERVAKGEAVVSGCLAGGPEVAKKISEILGVEEPEIHKKVAAVRCGAKERERKRTADYSGVKTCAAAQIVDGAGLRCKYGCLGFGDCVYVCPFDAIKMVNGLPVVNPEKCTACGKCATACPRKIITLIPYDFRIVVACSSHEKGAETRKICPVGCIACKICEKEVPEVFKVIDNLAVIDYSKVGINCDKAIEKCPTKCILLM